MSEPTDVIEEIEVLVQVDKYKGVMTVVRLVQVDGQRFIDVRDRVDVDGEFVWGRGYLLPPELGRDVGQAIMQGAKRRGTAA